MTDRRICTFHVGALLLGVDVERVQEVLRDEVVIPVPLAHAGIAGLLNLRGQIATAIDARHCLGLAPQESVSSVINIVIRSGGEALTLLVDREGEVIDVADITFEPVPETVSDTIRALAIGAYKVHGGLLLLLDPDRTLAVASN